MQCPPPARKLTFRPTGLLPQAEALGLLGRAALAQEHAAEDAAALASDAAAGCVGALLRASCAPVLCSAAALALLQLRRAALQVSRGAAYCAPPRRLVDALSHAASPHVSRARVRARHAQRSLRCGGEGVVCRP